MSCVIAVVCATWPQHDRNSTGMIYYDIAQTTHNNQTQGARKTGWVCHGRHITKTNAFPTHRIKHNIAHTQSKTTHVPHLSADNRTPETGWDPAWPRHCTHKVEIKYNRISILHKQIIQGMAGTEFYPLLTDQNLARTGTHTHTHQHCSIVLFLLTITANQQR